MLYGVHDYTKLIPRLSDIMSSKVEPCSFRFRHKIMTPNSATVLVPSFCLSLCPSVPFCLFLRPFFGWCTTLMPFYVYYKSCKQHPAIDVYVCNNIGLCCYNPCCGGRRNLFPTAHALSVHLARSPACKEFANKRDRKRKERKVALMNADFVVHSSKRPTLLCRDVVNDITQHITQNEPDREVVLKDWTDFNFADMYGNEMEV